MEQKVEILNYTTKEPLEMIGYCSGICYNSPLDDKMKNIKRAKANLKSGHMRTSEFPDIYVKISGFSARVMREIYTHLGGMPTRLQMSTRYVNYAEGDFEYYTPPSIAANGVTKKKWDNLMSEISERLKELNVVDAIPHEDLANGLPLGMGSVMVIKLNLRCAIEMSHQRECTCALLEFRQFMKLFKTALKEYGVLGNDEENQWEYIIDNYFKPKCEYLGYCNEGKRSCGRKEVI